MSCKTIFVPNWPIGTATSDIPMDEKGYRFRNPEYNTNKQELFHAKIQLKNNQTLSQGHDSTVMSRRSDRLRDRIGITKYKARTITNQRLRYIDIQVIESIAFIKSIKNSNTPVHYTFLLKLDSLITEL